MPASIYIILEVAQELGSVTTHNVYVAAESAARASEIWKADPANAGKLAYCLSDDAMARSRDSGHDTRTLRAELRRPDPMRLQEWVAWLDAMTLHHHVDGEVQRATWQRIE